MISFLHAAQVYLPAMVIFFAVLIARQRFAYVVASLNAVQTNVWAMAIISLGAFLMIKGYKSEGSSLLTGGFALLRGPGGPSITTKTGDSNAKPTQGTVAGAPITNTPIGP